MTRYFITMDDAYAFVERMSDKFDNYSVEVTAIGIRVEVF